MKLSDSSGHFVFRDDTSQIAGFFVIRNSLTGKILDEGKTSGGTGDTQRIMGTPLRSTQPLSDAHTAKYKTTIDFEEPTLVKIEAHGPMSQLQSALMASATQLSLYTSN